MDLLLAIAYSAGVGLFLLCVCVAIEQVAAIERYSMRERIPGILMNVVGPALGVALMYPIGTLWQALGWAPFMTIPLWSWLEPLGLIGYALQFITLVVVADFLAYWRHRAEHAWFWPIHAVHHAPRELHAANNIGHPIQMAFTFFFISVPMSLIQIDGPAAPIFVGLLTSFLATYIHTPIDFHFGPLRRVIVDNRFHRIHHSLEPRHFEKNFGICLSIWDHMFGTAYQPGREWPKVGVAEIDPPRNLREFLLLPLKTRQPAISRSDDSPAAGEEGILVACTGTPAFPDTCDNS